MFYNLNYYIKQIILNTSAILMWINDYFQEKYPTQYNNFIVNISYTFIHFFSQVQLFGIKCKNKINIWLDSNNYLKSIIDNLHNSGSDSETEENEITVTQFTNGNIITKKYLKELQNNFEVKENSLYIFDNFEKGHSIISRSQVFPEDYEVSNIKFLMVELNVCDKKLKIDLMSEDENYYIVQNVLDKDFFFYYMVTHSHDYPDINIVEDLKKSLIENATVKIIDDNANIVEVDFNKNQSIVILKDTYTIK
jgi:hypothetical protein